MILIKRLHNDCLEFQKAWTIYETSFPENERRLYSEQIKLFFKKNYFCSVIMENNTVIGIIFYWKIFDWIYIDHFAISPSLRGHGIGGEVLFKLKSRYNKIVLEIEPFNSPDSIRRKNFYERNGFNIYDYKYYHPSFGHRYEPYPLVLMGYGFEMTQNDAASLQDEIWKLC